jgi:hypothetical protein
MRLAAAALGLAWALSPDAALSAASGSADAVRDAPERPALAWADAFPVSAAPTVVHFSARYRDARGVWHRLETWRRGESGLHRRTDDRIDLYAQRADGAEMRLRLLDHQRHLAVDLSRTDLYRIGVLADAFGLAHVIDPPKGGYRVEAASAPAGFEAGTPGDGAGLGGLGRDCRWRLLLRIHARPARSLVCWSAGWGLPMLVMDLDAADEAVAASGSANTAGGQVVFRIEAVDGKPDPEGLNALPAVPAGYAQFQLEPAGGAEVD